MNKTTKLPSFWKWGLLALPLALVVAVAVLIAWGQNSADPAKGAGATPQPDFSMQVLVYDPAATEGANEANDSCRNGVDGPGGDTLIDKADPECQVKAPATDKKANPGLSPPATGCSTKLPETQADQNCAMPVGTQFSIQVSINNLKGLVDADNDGKAGYKGMQVHLQGSAGLTLKNRQGTNEIIWPDCAGGFPAENKISSTPPVDYLVACATGIGVNESVFIGPIVQVDFNCATLGKQFVDLLFSGALPSQVVPESGPALPGDGGQAFERLTVDCQPAPAEININVVDAKTNVKLGGSSFDIFYIDAGGNQVRHDTVPDNGGGTKLSDSDPASGNLRIGIGSHQLAQFGFLWHAVMVQAPVKYDPDTTKLVCDLSQGKCDRTARAQATSGDLSISVTNNTLGTPIDNICFDIRTQVGGVNQEPPIKKVCSNAAGQIGPQNLLFGTYSVEVQAAKIPERLLEVDPTKTVNKQKCVLSNDPAQRSCDLSFSYRLQSILNLKHPQLSNLFLTDQRLKGGDKFAPRRCAESTDVATFHHALSAVPRTVNPKGEDQQVGSFAFEVRFDPKLVCVDIEPGEYPTATGMDCFILDMETSVLQGIARIGCVFKGKKIPKVTGDVLVKNYAVWAPRDSSQPGDPQPAVTHDIKLIPRAQHLAYLFVRPMPEVYSQIMPNQENGIIVQILNQDCKLGDTQGHPIVKDPLGLGGAVTCDDSDLTLRFLEGDLVADCQVDVLDQAAIAFRWGARKGHLNYNGRMDLSPSGTVVGGATVNGDGRIDILDLQAVWGRHGSVCNHQNQYGFKGPEHPEQAPRHAK